jgi:hypothetical protein
LFKPGNQQGCERIKFSQGSSVQTLNPSVPFVRFRGIRPLWINHRR